jgi:hypothetical protein
MILTFENLLVRVGYIYAFAQWVSKSNKQFSTLIEGSKNHKVCFNPLVKNKLKTKFK